MYPHGGVPNFRHVAVPADSEFQRIYQLPRRVWRKADKERLARKLTAKLKTPNGKQVLWTDQAVALFEAKRNRGLVGGLRTSGGKSLVSFLVPTMFPELERPLLICPSKSITSGKTKGTFDAFSEHWQIRRDISWISYEQLQGIDFAEYLIRHRPGIIMLDECHKAGARKSSRSARVAALIREHSDTVVVNLSGTLLSVCLVDDSLRLCDWALRARSPLPEPESRAAKLWRGALALKPQIEAGALNRLRKDNESLIAAVGRRYRQTPGVVISTGANAIGAELICKRVRRAICDVAVTSAIKDVKAKRNPDGTEILDPDGKQQARVVRELSHGYYHYYDPKPPQEWLDAYKAFCSYSRERIDAADDPVDTPLRVELAYPDEWPVANWLAIKPSYARKPKVRWISLETVDAAYEWMRKHRHGIVWTQHPAFGLKLAERHGVPYYGAQAVDARTGTGIYQHKKGTPCVASISVCSEDLDLQHLFYQNLVVSPPAGGKYHEQLIARTHRVGQAQPEVTVDYWLSVPEDSKALDKAIERELSIVEFLKDRFRKLNICEWCL